MPNGKTDVNNMGPFSTDMIGENWNYPEADYKERKEIATKIEEYTKSKKSLSIYQIQKEITQLKKQEDYSWLKEVNAQSLQQSIKDLDSDFSHFFRKK